MKRAAKLRNVEGRMWIPLEICSWKIPLSKLTECLLFSTGPSQNVYPGSHVGSFLFEAFFLKQWNSHLALQNASSAYKDLPLYPLFAFPPLCLWNPSPRSCRDVSSFLRVDALMICFTAVFFNISNTSRSICSAGVNSSFYILDFVPGGRFGESFEILNSFLYETFSSGFNW